MVEGVELVRDKNVVAAIDFRQAVIYPTDASPGQRPDHLVATDPRGRFHKVHHRAGNPDGTYEDDSPEYWREVTEALVPAAAILLLGHGAGKANASHHWVAYVEKHRKDVAAKVVADVRVDIDHLDDTQVLRLAQYYFAGPPLEGLRGRSLGGVTGAWACYVPEPWFRLRPGRYHPEQVASAARRGRLSPRRTVQPYVPGRLQHHHRAGADLPVDGEPDQWVPRRVAVGAD